MHERNAMAQRRTRGGGPGRMMLIVVLLSMAAASALAEGFAYDLAGELMSPFCPGRTLASCPSPQAAELVQWISLQEAAGATRDDVIEMLIDRFGEEILGAPPAKGITLWAYVFPVVGFVLGGGLVVLALQRLVRRGGVAEEVGGPDPAAPQGQPTADRSADERDDMKRTGAEISETELERLVDAELAGRGGA